MSKELAELPQLCHLLTMTRTEFLGNVLGWKVKEEAFFKMLSAISHELIFFNVFLKAIPAPLLSNFPCLKLPTFAVCVPCYFTVPGRILCRNLILLIII